MRILPAILGALTVALTYSLGRRIWGEAVALVAAILLTGAHVHLQYSRLGMSNIWDPLMLLLPLGLLAWPTAVASARAGCWPAWPAA